MEARLILGTSQGWDPAAQTLSKRRKTLAQGRGFPLVPKPEGNGQVRGQDLLGSSKRPEPLAHRGASTPHRLILITV